VHQCSRFVALPKQEHGNAVKWICRYLLGTRDKGIMWKMDEFDKDEEEKLTCFIDSDFAGNYIHDSDQSDDTNTARSRYGYVIKYHGVPLVWASKLQTLIALSSTESEYIGLSEASRVVVTIIRFLLEMKAKGFNKRVESPVIKCKLFEDNMGALTMENIPKISSRTKYIHTKYHYFQTLVKADIL